MRAPNPSFKSELASFRASRKLPVSPGSKGPLGIGNRNSADMEIMSRWLARANQAEEIWREVKRKAPALTPPEFIQAVLKARRSAVASVNRIYGVPGSLPGFNAEWAELLVELKKRITDRFSRSTISPTKAVETLEDAADQISMLHDLYFAHSDQVKFSLSRKGKAGNRSRVAFYRLMSGYLQKQCRGQLYHVIAFTAEIAFDVKEIDVDSVRYALRRAKETPKKRKRLH
jgi:hypothetical protein